MFRVERSLVFCSLLPIVFGQPAFASTPSSKSKSTKVAAHRSNGPKPLSNPVFEIGKKLAAIPENKLDVGEAEILLEKQVWPDIDLNKRLNQLDLITVAARNYLNGTTDPKERIAKLNTLFYKFMGFAYNFDLKLTEHRASTLAYLLETKKGTCYSLPILYMTVAQRLGFPVYGVTAPRHLFLRYVDGANAINIEPTTFGGVSSDSDYARNLNIPKSAVESGVYMRTLSNREVLSIQISTYAGTRYGKELDTKKLPFDDFRARAATEEIIKNYALALKLDSRNASAIVGSGRRYHALAILGRRTSQETWAHWPTALNANLKAVAQADFSMADGYDDISEDTFHHAEKLGLSADDFSEDWDRKFYKEIAEGRKDAEAKEAEFARLRKQAMTMELGNIEAGGLQQ